MSLLFSVIARDKVIVGRYANYSGNFDSVCRQVLDKIDINLSKHTLSHGSYFFHYISENGVIYMCFTDQQFDRPKAFSYLDMIKKVYHSTFSQTTVLNTELSKALGTYMRAFSSLKPVDELTAIQREVNDVKSIMVKNIDALAERGVNLNKLVDRSEDLEVTSVSFKTASHSITRLLCVKHAKTIIIGSSIALVLILAVVLYVVYKHNH